MPDFNNSLDIFIEKLNANKYILCQDEKWYTKLPPSSTYSLLTLCNKQNEIKRLIRIAQSFCIVLDKLERNTASEEYKKNSFTKYVDATEAIVSYINRYQFKSADLADALIQLKRRSIGLYYRNLSSEDITKFQPLEKAQEKLFLLAKKWKQSQLFAEVQQESLSQQDINRLQNTSHYDLFLSLLHEDKTLQDNFFNWIIRDNNEAEPFIEFPATSDRLHHCYIDLRMGYYNQSLRVESKETKEGLQKILRLPFFLNNKTSYMNILDESITIPFSSNGPSIKAIFDEFANKEFQHGQYEFLEKGISKWKCDNFCEDIIQCSYISERKVSSELKNDSTGNLKNCSHTNKITYLLDNWWEELPVFHELTKENIQIRYNLKTLPDNHWIKCLRVSTVSLSYQIKDNHAFIEVAIPDKKNKSYRIYPFGYYPKQYPRSLTEQATAVYGTLLAKMEYPDSNTFKSDHIQFFFPKVISSDEGIKLMHTIQKDVASVFMDNLPIQVMGENCAFLAGHRFTQNDISFSRNPFEVTLAEMKPAYCGVRLLANLPFLVQWPILACMRRSAAHHTLEIQEEEKPIKKQVQFSSSFKNQKFFVPIKLARDILENKKEGTFHFGFDSSARKEEAFLPAIKRNR